MLKLEQLRDANYLKRSFEDYGLNDAFISRRISQCAVVSRALVEQGNDEHAETISFFVPGRIEVLGKHTDYAGGKSLTCAVDRGFLIAAIPREDATLAITIAPQAADRNHDRVTFEISSDLSPTVGHWSNYPMTVARRLAMNFSNHDFPSGKWRGANIVFTSDLPPAAGLSSSSALIIAMYKILAAINHLDSHPAYRKNITGPESLAEYLGAVENGRNYRELMGTVGVGTLGGSEDHVAILCSEADNLKCFSYAPTQFLQKVPLPTGWCFVIGSSGARAEKTGAAMKQYNRLSRMTAEVTAAWRKQMRGDTINLAAVISDPGYSPQELTRILQIEHSPLEVEAYLRRVEHFIAEDQEYIPVALKALSSDDMNEFCKVVNESHNLGDRLLENQIPETRALVRMARELGALGSSAFGAGFGGSVYAIAERLTANDFCKKWQEQYRSEFPNQAANAEFFTCIPSPAVFELK